MDASERGGYADEMTDELARIYEFIVRNDMVGSRTETLPWGRAVFAPEFPLRHDANYVMVESIPKGLDAETLANEVERIQGAAGLPQRVVFFPDAVAASRLVRDLAGAGWTASHGVVMAVRRAPDRTLDLSSVVETDEETLRAVRFAQLRTYPWGTEDVARQMLDASALIPIPVRNLAVFAGGEPVAWGDLRVEGDVAQIEALATAEAHRGRGHASRIVLRACELARAAGATSIFLCAHAEDWPRQLYRRLGFDEIGRYAKCVRARGA
jgi:GNAT superfamily N-acetyltransferase